MSKDVKFLKTFRARLMLLLTACLLLTIAVVLILDYLAQRSINEAIIDHNQRVAESVNDGYGDLMYAVSLATYSLDKDQFLYQLISPDEIPQAVECIIIADKDGRVKDSSLPIIIQEERYRTIHVPKEVQAEISSETAFLERDDHVLAGDPLLGGEISGGPNEKTYYYPINTAKGLHWIVIVTNQGPLINKIAEATNQLASENQRLSNYRQWATTGLLLVALAIAVIIGWQFTRPIQQLASAARRIADSQLNFRVNIERKDEIGQLAATFNDMIDGLKHKQELEEKLNNAERAAVIGRLTQSVAHEIRNPLNVINLSIDHVSTKYAPEDEEKRKKFMRILSSIKDEVTRLKHMVNDLLNYGRPAHLAKQKFDMRELMCETLALVRPQADEQGVEFDVKQDETPASVNGDREKLKSCLSNIAINALQAMPAGGQLMTSVHQSNGAVEVKIEDTGVGIPRDDLSRIFEPYFSTKQTGFGLGLAVTKKIIDEHKGSIEAESEVGTGTTFIVRLDAADEKD